VGSVLQPSSCFMCRRAPRVELRDRATAIRLDTRLVAGVQRMLSAADGYNRTML
jgi:hypothetical protein